MKPRRDATSTNETPLRKHDLNDGLALCDLTMFLVSSKTTRCVDLHSLQT